MTTFNGQAAALLSETQATTAATVEPSVNEVLVVDLSPKPQPQPLLTRINELRSKTDEVVTRYFVAGRNALTAMLADAYALYYEVYYSAEQADILKEMKQVLAEKDKFVPRADTKLSSIFIRYVFSTDDNHTQRHLYSVALDFALTSGTHPDDFSAFVKANKGLEAIRKDNATKRQGTAAAKEQTTEHALAMSILQSRSAFDTVSGDTLGFLGEEFLVVIALPNEDGTMRLVNPELLEDDNLKILNFVVKAKKALAGGAKTKCSTTQAQRNMALSAKGEVGNQELKISELELDLKVAQRDNHLDKIDNLKARLVYERSLLGAKKEALKKMRKAFKDGDSVDAA